MAATSRSTLACYSCNGHVMHSIRSETRYALQFPFAMRCLPWVLCMILILSSKYFAAASLKRWGNKKFMGGESARFSLCSSPKYLLSLSLSLSLSLQAAAGKRAGMSTCSRETHLCYASKIKIGSNGRSVTHFRNLSLRGPNFFANENESKTTGRGREGKQCDEYEDVSEQTPNTFIGVLSFIGHWLRWISDAQA
jgi:hypothetical protein